MAYNNKKVDPYLDVMLRLVSKTSTYDTPNSIYLELFGYIGLDFRYFENKEFVQYSLNPNFIFLVAEISLKKLLRQIKKYIVNKQLHRMA